MYIESESSSSSWAPYQTFALNASVDAVNLGMIGWIWPAPACWPSCCPRHDEPPHDGGRLLRPPGQPRTRQAGSRVDEVDVDPNR